MYVSRTNSITHVALVRKLLMFERYFKNLLSPWTEDDRELECEDYNVEWRLQESLFTSIQDRTKTLTYVMNVERSDNVPS